MEIPIAQLDVDKLLLRLGWKGYYQLFIALLLSLQWIFHAFQSMSWAFIGLHHPFTCVQINSTSALASNASALSYDKQCLSPIDNKTACGTDGLTTFVFDPTFGTTLTSEYLLICDRYVLAKLGTTLYTLGGLIGDIPIAQLSDLVGRKWVFLSCYWIAMALTLLRTQMNNYIAEMVIYVMLGASTAGVVSTGYVLSCEHLTPEVRGVGLSMMENLIWVVGYMLQGVAVYLQPNWRWMVFYTNVPFLLTISFVWLIPESLHWLVAENHHKQAESLVPKLLKLNCASKRINLKECQKDKEVIGDRDRRPRRTVIDVLKSPILLFHGLITCYNGCIAMLVYWALSLYSTQMSDDRFTGYFLQGLIEIPAGIMGPLLLFKIGRRTLTIIAQVVTAIGFIARIFCPADAPSWLTLSTYLVAKYGNILIWPGNFLLQAEIFPTTLRNIGYGLMATISSLGNMAAPFLGDLLTNNPPLGSGIFVFLCLSSAFVTLALPETKDQELPEDIPDVPLGPFLSKFVKKSTKHNTNSVINAKMKPEKESVL